MKTLEIKADILEDAVGGLTNGEVFVLQSFTVPFKPRADLQAFLRFKDCITVRRVLERAWSIR